MPRERGGIHIVGWRVGRDPGGKKDGKRERGTGRDMLPEQPLQTPHTFEAMVGAETADSAPRRPQVEARPEQPACLTSPSPQGCFSLLPPPQCTSSSQHGPGRW